MSTKKQEIKNKFHESVSPLHFKFKWMRQRGTWEMERKCLNLDSGSITKANLTTQAGLATLTQDPLHLVKSSAIENQSHALPSWTTFLELQALLTPEHCLPPSGICSWNHKDWWWLWLLSLLLGRHIFLTFPYITQRPLCPWHLPGPYVLEFRNQNSFFFFLIIFAIQVKEHLLQAGTNRREKGQR